MRTKLSISFGCIFAFIAILLPSLDCEGDGLPPERTVQTRTLSDPLFGINYSPAKVHFQEAPNIVYKCKGLKKRHGDLFMFGVVHRKKVHFYYVYGWEQVESHDGVRHLEAEDNSGIFVVIGNNACLSIGAGYAWSPLERDRQEAMKMGITKKVVAELLSDAVNREVVAFGGRDRFLRQLSAINVDESTLPVQVQKKTVNFTWAGLNKQ